MEAVNWDIIIGILIALPLLFLAIASAIKK